MAISSSIVRYTDFYRSGKTARRLETALRMQARVNSDRILLSSSSIQTPIQVGSRGLVHPEVFARRMQKIVDWIKDPAGKELTQSAFLLAWEGHAGQFRKSGDPYIDHPLAVAEICAEWGLGYEEIAAALCHDLREDGRIAGQKISREMIAQRLNERVAMLVEGITELGTEREFQGAKPGHVEMFGKLLEYGSKDVYTILVKLADRLHNMRTLGSMPEKARSKKAEETLHVYARLADRLGSWLVKRELEDLSFRYLEPAAYQQILVRREELIARSQERLEQIKGSLGRRLDLVGRDYELIPEQRGIYELHERMMDHDITLDHLTSNDVWRINIVVPDRSDCHVIQGQIHDTLFPPIQSENYYAKPRPNGHRFLHTYVLVPQFGRLLIQIRDRKMFDFYQLGIMTSAKRKKDSGWLRALLDDLRQEEAISDQEFRRLVGQHSVPIVVYTPKGKRIPVPYGSTPLEVALKIHGDIFRRAEYAIVNGQEVGLDHRLSDGDEVEIVSGPRGRPSIEWMDLVQTPAAIRAVQEFLRKRDGQEIMRDALGALDLAGKKHFLSANDLLETELFAAYFRSKGQRQPDQILNEIGTGRVRAEVVLADFMQLYLRELAAAKQDKAWNLIPYYLSIELRDRVGLSDSLVGPLRALGYNVSEIFPVYTQDLRQVILVLGVDVAPMGVGGGRVAQIQRLQVETVAQQAMGSEGNLTRLRPQDIIRYLRMKIKRLANGLA